MYVLLTVISEIVITGCQRKLANGQIVFTSINKMIKKQQNRQGGQKVEGEAGIKIQVDHVS